VEEPGEAGCQADGDGEGADRQPADGCPAEFERCSRRERGREVERLASRPVRVDYGEQQQGHTQRPQQEVHVIGMPAWQQNQQVEQGSGGRHGNNTSDDGHPQWHSRALEQLKHDEGAKGTECSLGEVRDTGRLVQQDDSEAEQPVQGADRDPTDDPGEQQFHTRLLE